MTSLALLCLRQRRSALALILALCTWAPVAGLAQAAETAAPPAPGLAAAPFGLKGTTLDGRSLDLASLRGKVVMVFYWNTACSVCMQKMAELRANAAGWRGKPFELILVSTDGQRQDVQNHARLVRLFDAQANLPTLWMGDPDYRDTLLAPPRRLPLTLVLDVDGKLAKRYDGRIAPEAWDQVADLLP